MATTAEPSEVRIANASEEDEILAALSLAFSADPGIRWYFPAPPQFHAHFPAFARAYGGKAFDHGAAYAVEDFAGAALWLPPNVHPDNEEIVGVMQSALSEEKLTLVGEFIERVESSHPTEPFWELAVLGVEPTQQRKGYGHLLIEPVLEHCDREEIPAFLISSNVQNLSFYLRHGFDIVDTIHYPNAPPFFPMRRDPQA